MSDKQNNSLPAIALSLGIVVAGYLMGEALIQAFSSERQVSVRARRAGSGSRPSALAYRVQRHGQRTRRFATED